MLFINMVCLTAALVFSAVEIPFGVIMVAMASGHVSW
jgi:hypothetical protein